MKNCKKLEIVIEKPLVRMVEAGAPGYTLIDHASGMGDRGTRRADDPTGSSTNCLFIIACENADDASRLVECVRPILSRSAGMCLVSDALWIRH